MNTILPLPPVPKPAPTLSEKMTAAAFLLHKNQKDMPEHLQKIVSENYEKYWD